MRSRIATLLGTTTVAAAMIASLHGTAAAGGTTEFSGGDSAAGIANPPSAAGQGNVFATDYPGAEQRPANSANFTPADRPNSNPIDKIVIHVTEGSWDSAVNWFADPASQVSAHYVVRSGDGHIAQAVPEKDIAWHAGNWEYNQTAIGIEHEAFVDDPSYYTEAMYDSSAHLVADITKRYNIPIDRQHIIGHSEVPGATHTDPGPNWNWDHYMQLVTQYAGS